MLVIILLTKCLNALLKIFVSVVSINTGAGFIIGWFFYTTDRWAYVVVSLHATVLPSDHAKKGCERD